MGRQHTIYYREWQEYTIDNWNKSITEGDKIEIKQKKVNIEPVTGPNQPHFLELNSYGTSLQPLDVCVTDVAGAKKILQENNLLPGNLTESFDDTFQNHTGSIIMVPAYLWNRDKRGPTYILLYQNNLNQVDSWTPFWPQQPLGGKLYSTIDGKPRTGYRYGNYLRYLSIGEYDAVCKWPVGTIGTELPAEWQVDQFNTAVKNIQRAKEQELQRAKEQEQRVEKYRRWRRISRTYDASRPLNTGRLSYLLPVNPLQTQRD